GGSQEEKKKKANEEENENSLVLATGPTPMYFPPSQGCSTKLSSEKTQKSACGSSQPDALSIQYPSQNSSEPAPPAPTQPIGKRKREGKAAEVKPKAKKTKGAAITKKTKGAATTKKKQPLVPMTPQSPAMCTRSKNPESPAMSTRSKRKILD
ncbi:unnamed protein product, partial [Urochloa humidicola]